MKIYPSFHRIEETERIRPGDIPLSYIATDKKENETRITKVRENLRAAQSVSVMPYEPFKNQDAYLFNSSGERLQLAPMMHRIGDTYYFIPKNAVEFKPQEFSFSVLYKRDITFTNEKQYNFKAACIDGQGEISKRLISIFGDAPRRGLSPSNISINNGDMARESLINMSFDEADFVFIESADGTHFGSGTVPINHEEILGRHANLWLSVDSFGDAMIDRDGSSFEKGGGAIYSGTSYELPGYAKAFDLELLPEAFSSYRAVRLFDGQAPILVLESPMKGFIVISEKSLIENAGTHHKFIYEVMASILFNAYKKSPQRVNWITDSIVDHVGMKESVYGYTHGLVTITDAIEKDEIPSGEEFLLLGVETSSSDVMFRGTTQNGTILLEKNGSRKDPVKEQGMVSVYTTRNTVMLYRKEQVLKVESSFEAKIVKGLMNHYVEIEPYKSSSLRIHTEELQKLSLPMDEKTRFIVCKDNRFALVLEEAYEEIDHGIKLAKIESYDVITKENYDMRIHGGGMPESSVSDQNLLDVSSIEGRAYRKGNVTVVRVPKRLKPYKDKIEDALKNHISSGDVPIIVFE